MVTIDASARGIDGVTLVTVRLSGEGVARRVRVEQRLDGPVWPPRCEGRPEAGWDETGYEGVVPADGRLVLGYATPAPPDEDPVAVEEGAVVRDGAAETDAGGPTDILQRLGDPSPPREAVPLPPTAYEADRSDDESDGQRSGQDGRSEPDSGEQGDAGSDGTPADRATDPVAAWLDRVSERVATVETLDDVESVPDATAAVEAAGGFMVAERSVRATAADRRRLLAVADRAGRLAERIEATEPPLSTLERLR